MKKYFGHITVIITVVIVYVLLVSNGCSTPNHEGFAIYLTKGDIPPAQMPALSHVDIAEQPIIAMNDIISYNAQTHELKLTANAYEDISQLDVPVSGKSFMVCVDKKLIYFGAFWTPVSSISFDGVTIWKPLSLGETRIINLELGYPSSSFYELPRSMKGYELYSWSEDSLWHFTLITGTNRNKTLKEIISNEDFISEAGWVQIHVIGVDAIKTVLSKLPQNEHVFWLAGMRSEQTSQGNVNIALPEGPTIDTIKEHAELCGLDFMVQTP